MIDDEGKQLGVMPPWEALKIAREKGLDLVEISPTVVPPVCKIMDYGRFLYQQNKKAHETRKHQKTVHIKEVKFRPATNEHDYNFKKNNIIRFLCEGDKVRAIIVFRGREMAHQEMGRGKLKRLIEEVSQHGMVEVPPRLEQNLYSVMLAPKKTSGSPPPPPAKPAPSTSLPSASLPSASLRASRASRAGAEGQAPGKPAPGGQAGPEASGGQGGSGGEA